MNRRVVVEHLRPTVDGGAFAAKATVGLPMEISADIFADGHEELLAWAVLAPTEGVRPASPTRGERKAAPAASAAPQAGGTPGTQEVKLSPVGNDHWVGCLVPAAIGPWELSVSGAVDDYGTWLRDLRLRHDDGQDVELELEEGRLLVEGRMRRRGLTARDRGELDALAASLSPLRGAGARVRSAGSARAIEVMRRTLDTDRATTAGPYPVWVDRELGGFSAWYELFPRSEGATETSSGTFATASKRLPGVAAMGFDIVYLPPIHPIGRSFRKGPNNTIDAPPGAVGSPWAIGGPEGGHTAVNPDLGTIEDFDRFVAAASRAGLEVALDYALQSSPDHPWVKEHPQWFVHRPDGTIRYAENPPKRYQDIYPLNFDTKDRAGLDAALLAVMRFWIGHGVRVFRVDNPHTKPFEFWRWLIDNVHRDHPEVIFLAEAFTRPRTMEWLAKLGFTQSYTYFTWRNAKAELSDYLTELSQGPAVDYFRPNFWVNTPDILHAYLQEGGPPAFRVRLVLAALACCSWGMYSGFELFENTPVRTGSEEYLDSEKYQLRPRDWQTKGSLAPMVTTVNQVRRRHHEAIALTRTMRLHHVDSEYMLCFSRRSHSRDDVLLVVVNLDPHNVREATVWPDLGELGVDPTRPYQVVDELNQATYKWAGPSSYVRLDPRRTPAHVLRIHQEPAP